MNFKIIFRKRLSEFWKSVTFIFILISVLYLYIQINRLKTESKKAIRYNSNEEIFDDNNPVSMEDEGLLEYIRNKHLFPPAPQDTKLNLSGKMHSSDIIRRLLGGKRNGFFIECGAVDGEYISNTIDLEVNFGWTGLLIEGSPALFQQLRTKNRKSWSADICLTSTKPEKIEFLKHKAKFPEWRIGNGKINPGKKYAKPGVPFENEVFRREDYLSEGFVDCFPLYSVLLAMDVSTVDFFSLDVEGHEYKILSAIPFDKVHIKMILVEHWIAPEGSQAIKQLLIQKGYTLVYESNMDFIFKKV